MDIQINNSYKILIEINNTILTYKCKVIALDENFITFVDDRNKEYTYNKKCILSYSLLDYDIKINKGDSRDVYYGN